MKEKIYKKEISSYTVIDDVIEKIIDYGKQNLCDSIIK